MDNFRVLYLLDATHNIRPNLLPKLSLVGHFPDLKIVHARNLDLSALPEGSFVLFLPIIPEYPLNLSEVPDEFTWLVLDPTYPLLTATELGSKQIGWIARSGFLQQLSINLWDAILDPYYLITRLSEQKIMMGVMGVHKKSASINLCEFEAQDEIPKTILAIIPHLNCHYWLEQSLLSLVHQTRPLDGIVVVDDGSIVSPEAICSRYPEVTLLTSPGKVGPYQIIQSIVSSTDYEAYLFQDADDWSTPERLAILLELMAVSGADMVGSQEIRVDELGGMLSPVTYPLDVSLALTNKPGHALLHPTSLIRRSAILSLGGFSNGLMFGGDTEFLLRAHFCLKICNSPNFSYFRRKRSHSLTTSPSTGLESPARQSLLQKLKQNAYENYDRFRQGLEPDISPSKRVDPIDFQWVGGPQLQPFST